MLARISHSIHTFFFFLLTFFFFFNFWLRWVFVAVWELSLVAESRGYSLVAACGLIIAAASPAAEHRLRKMQASVVAARLSSWGTPSQLEGFPGVSDGKKRLPTTQETRVRSLGREDPLEKEMATYTSTLAWKIPWTEDQSSWTRDWICVPCNGRQIPTPCTTGAVLFRPFKMHFPLFNWYLILWDVWFYTLLFLLNMS